MNAPRPSNPNNHAELMETLCSLAEQAGRLVLEVYGTDFPVFQKNPGDFVTVADQRANELLCDELKKRYSDIPIVAEESDPARYSGFSEQPSAFFVDPVDGTNEFVARNGEFVVMIGYAEQGVATVGAVHSPTQGLTWFGALGYGAYEQDAQGNRRPLSVSSTSTLPEARLLVSRSRHNKQLAEILSRLRLAELRTLGSAGLKASQVAIGAADAYVQMGHSGSLWDLCGPEAIVTAAGGRYSNTAGDPIQYNQPYLEHHSGLIVSNGRLHERLLAAIGSDTATIMPPS